MVLGVLRLELDLHGAQSLKDKRRVVKSLIDRLHRRFNVAAAEIEAQDQRIRAVLAVACVSNERRHVDEVLAHIAGWVDRESRGTLLRYEVQVL